MIKLLSTGLGVLVLAGLPLFVLIFAIAALIYSVAGLDLTLMFVEIFNRITDNPIFLTIPLFAHAGYVLTESGAGKRLVELTHALLGWMPGGTAIVTVSACGIFTAFTGASGVTIVAMGGLLWPLLKDEGYRERYRLGLLTSCGSLGLLFPPSLPAIVMALVVSAIVPVGVKTLFTACLLPGLFLVLVLSVHGIVVQVRDRGMTRDAFDMGRVLRAFRAAAWEIPIPFLVVFGIFGGWLTTVDAAALVCAACIIVEVFIRREITTRDLSRITVRAMVLVGAILIIVMAAFALSNVLTDQEFPQKILGLLEGVIESRWTFLIALNVFLLLVGCMMDIYSAILVVVPILYPVAMRFGVDPVHLAVIILVNLEIGYLTPPVGINLFIASLRFSRPVPLLYRASLPFISLLLVCLVVVTWMPELSLGLLRLREDTGQVVMRVSRRQAAGALEGRVRWGKRARGATTETDVFLEPSDDGEAQSLRDAHIVFDATSSLLRISIGAGEGTRIDGTWKCPSNELRQLQKTGTESVEHLDIVLDDAELQPLLGGDAQVFGSELVVHSVVDSVIEGELHLTILYFPEDPDAQEVVWDCWVHFRTGFAVARPSIRPVVTADATMVIDHLRGVWRPSVDNASSGTLTIETMRNKPTGFVLRFPILHTSGTFPMDVELSGDQFQIFVTSVKGLPVLSGNLRVLASTLRVESFEDSRIRGSLLGVLAPISGAQLFDAEWKIDLPYHE